MRNEPSGIPSVARSSFRARLGVSAHNGPFDDEDKPQRHGKIAHRVGGVSLRYGAGWAPGSASPAEGFGVGTGGLTEALCSCSGLTSPGTCGACEGLAGGGAGDCVLG